MRLNEAGIIYYQGNEITRIYTENQIIYDINTTLNLATLDKYKFLRFFNYTRDKIIFRDTPLPEFKFDGSIRNYSHTNIATDSSMFDIDAYKYYNSMEEKYYYYIYCPRIISLPENSSNLFQNKQIDFNNRVTTRFTKNFENCFRNTRFFNIEFDFTNAENMTYIFVESNITSNSFKLANSFLAHNNCDINMSNAFQGTSINSTTLNALLTKPSFASHIISLDSCFRDCKWITEINLSNLNLANFGVDSAVWNYTFSNCTRLTHISFPSIINNQNKLYITFDHTFYNCQQLADTDIHSLLSNYDLSRSWFIQSFCYTQLSEICLTDTEDELGEFFGRLDYPFTESSLHTLILGKINMSHDYFLRGGCNCRNLNNLVFSPYYENFSSEITTATADIAPKSNVQIECFFKDTNFTQYHWFDKIIFNYTPSAVFQGCSNLTYGKLNVYNITYFDSVFANQKDISWDLYCFYSQTPPSDKIINNRIYFTYDHTFYNSDNSSFDHIIIPSSFENWTSYPFIGNLYNTFQLFDGDINLTNRDIFKNMIEASVSEAFMFSNALFIDFNFKLYGGHKAFFGCSNLHNINHNKAIEIIKIPYDLRETFTGCSSLLQIKLKFPELTYNNSSLHACFVVDSTFNDCSSLEHIYVYNTWENFTRRNLVLYSSIDIYGQPYDLISPADDFDPNVWVRESDKRIIFDHCYEMPGFQEEETYNSDGIMYKRGRIMTGLFGKESTQRIAYLTPYRDDN